MFIDSTGVSSKYAAKIQILGENDAPPEEDALAEQAKTLAINSAHSRIKKEATSRLSGLLGPFGVAASLIVDYVEDSVKDTHSRNNHLAGIKKLAEKNIPGMVYKKVSIDGSSHEIAIDASSQIENPHAEPVILVKRSNLFPWETSSSPSAVPNLKENDFTSYIDTLKNVANSQIEQFKQDWSINLPERKKNYSQSLVNFARTLENSPDNINLSPPENRLSLESTYEDLLNRALFKGNPAPQPSSSPSLNGRTP